MDTEAAVIPEPLIADMDEDRIASILQIADEISAQSLSDNSTQNHQPEQQQEEAEVQEVTPMGRQKSTLPLGPRANQTLRKDRAGRRQLKKPTPVVIKIEDEEPFVNEMAGQGESDF